MALPASPPISLQQIYAEFGAPNGTPLTALVRGGAYVPNIPQNNNVPTAPPLDMLDFLGATNQPPVSINDQNVFVIGNPSSGSALSGYRLNASGIAESREKTTYTTLETWLIAGAASDYEVRATITTSSGPGSVAGTFGSWLSLSSSREWSVNQPVSDLGSSILQFTVEIRSASSGTVLDSATIHLESER